MSKERIQSFVTFTMLLSAAGVALFLLDRKWLDNSALHPRVIAGSYQFLLVVVFGGAVSWLYSELTRLREREEHEEAEFLELYSDLVRAHNESKAVKRLLRAKAWRKKGDNDLLLTQPYSELLDRLNAVQLDFEALKRHVSGRNRLFRRVDELYGGEETDGKKDTLYGDLSRIEKYLNGIVNEYETALRSYPEAPPHLLLDDLERVKDFISPEDDAPDIRIAAKARFKSAISKLSQVAGQGDE